MTYVGIWRAVAAATAALTLVGAAACAEPSGGDDKVELSVFWWGDNARAENTKKVLARYTAAHPDVTFVTTYQGNSGYLDKLTVLAAGGNAPDLFQVDDNMLAELAERNVTLDLSPYVQVKKVDLSAFPPGLAQYGVIDGRQAGVALAENTPALIYNKTLLGELGAAPPTAGMTWEDFIGWAKGINERSGGAVAGTMDPSGDYKALWVWLRQQGKELYAGRQLGFTADDLTRWFQLWADARAGKATPPADLVHEANSNEPSKQVPVTRKGITAWGWSNSLTALARNTKDELALLPYPGAPSGQWARASMYWSASAKTGHKDVVADVMNFFVNDPEAARIQGMDRGITPNLKLRAEVVGGLTNPNDKATVTFESAMAPQFGPAPAPPPRGHAAIRNLLLTSAEAVLFGKAQPGPAATDFITQATQKLT